MSRGKTGNNPRKGNLRGPRRTVSPLPKTGDISQTRLAVLGYLTKEKKQVLKALSNFQGTMAVTRIENLLYLAEDKQAVIKELESERLIEPSIYYICKKCKQKLKSNITIVDENGDRHSGFTFCYQCRILGSEIDLQDIRPDKIYQVINEPGFIANKEAYKITARGISALDDDRQKQIEQLAKKLEQDLASGSTNRMSQFAKIIEAKFTPQQYQTATSGSLSTFWGLALENGFITKKQYTAAKRELGANWNYAGD